MNRSWVLVRGAALAVIAVAAVLLVDAVSRGDGLTVIDRPIWSWFVHHRDGALTVTFKVITQVGSTLVTGTAAAVTVLLLLWRKRRADAVFLAAVSIGAGAIVSVGKHLLGRARPPLAERLVVETNQSFPSGHALASIAIIGAMAILFVPTVRAGGRRMATLVAAALFLVAIGVSRLYLGVHWSTDVIGGWLAGGGWLLLCLTVRQVDERRARPGLGRRPAVPGSGTAVSGSRPTRS